MGQINKKKVIKIIVLLCIILLFFYFTILIFPIINPFFIALILAYLLDPLVDYFEGKGISRTWGILIIYSTLILAIATAIVYGLPRIIVELNRFVETIPLYATQIQDFITAFQRDYSRVAIPESIRDITDETIKNIENSLISIVKSIVQGIVYFFTKIFDIILAPILAFYLLKDFDNIKEWLLQLIPGSYRKDLVNLGQQIDKVLKSFSGSFNCSFFVGILTTIGLSLIGMGLLWS